MDADVASVGANSIGAAFSGQGWIDETFDAGTREHRYYTAVRMLLDRQPDAWLVYMHEVGWISGLPPSRRRRANMRRLFRTYLGEVGIDLFPIDASDGSTY